MEGSGEGHSQLLLTRYADGTHEIAKLATCNPHGHWIEWVDV
jgi:hypothetical protein